MILGAYARVSPASALAGVASSAPSVAGDDGRHRRAPATDAEMSEVDVRRLFLAAAAALKRVTALTSCRRQ